MFTEALPWPALSFDATFPKPVAMPEPAPVADEALVAATLRGDEQAFAEIVRRYKARVFASALGLTADQADELQTALLQAASAEEATATDADEYGQRYVIDFTMKGPAGEARVRSSWIVRTGEDFPRLTSSYVI